MKVQNPVVTVAYQGLVAQGVLEGASLDAAREAAAQKLSKDSGRSVQELLADQELRSVTWCFSADAEGRRHAQTSLEAAANFFGVTPDRLRGDLRSAISRANEWPELEQRVRQALFDPFLDKADRVLVIQMALRLEEGKRAQRHPEAPGRGPPTPKPDPRDPGFEPTSKR